MDKYKQIAVDIDGVLTEEIHGWGEDVYLSRTPRKVNIERINDLYNAGHKITLFTARHEEDRTITEVWLAQHKVKYHSLILDKIHYDLFIEDRAIPDTQNNLGEILNYNFHANCWRFKHGHISPDENHPCFFCCYEINVTVPDCPQCGIMPCPQCRRCLCNIPFLTYMTLIRIHKKYCCNLPEFSGVIELNGFVDNDVIHNCEKTLKHCKSLEGL